MTTPAGERRPRPRHRGARVYLRPIEPEDGALIDRWFQDAETSRLTGELPMSLARRRMRITAEGEGRDWFGFIICLIDDDRPIGRADLFEIDRRNGSAAFGLAIGEAASRGQGLGGDALDAIVDFVFGQLRLERLWLGTDADNHRAIRVYERAGFVHEARLRRSFYQDGVFQDEIRMAMLRSEWERLERPRAWDREGDSPEASTKPV
jgi:[ribosomal protein S5]-alanine N-acetyltransferase